MDTRMKKWCTRYRAVATIKAGVLGREGATANEPSPEHGAAESARRGRAPLAGHFEGLCAGHSRSRLGSNLGDVVAHPPADTALFLQREAVQPGRRLLQHRLQREQRLRRHDGHNTETCSHVCSAGRASEGGSRVEILGMAGGTHWLGCLRIRALHRPPERAPVHGEGDTPRIFGAGRVSSPGQDPGALSRWAPPRRRPGRNVRGAGLTRGTYCIIRTGTHIARAQRGRGESGGPRPRRCELASRVGTPGPRR